MNKVIRYPLFNLPSSRQFIRFQSPLKLSICRSTPPQEKKNMYIKIHTRPHTHTTVQSPLFTQTHSASGKIRCCATSCVTSRLIRDPLCKSRLPFRHKTGQTIINRVNLKSCVYNYGIPALSVTFQPG